jgi:hypothetical protein
VRTRAFLMALGSLCVGASRLDSGPLICNPVI